MPAGKPHQMRKPFAWTFINRPVDDQRDVLVDRCPHDHADPRGPGLRRAAQLTRKPGKGQKPRATSLLRKITGKTTE